MPVPAHSILSTRAFTRLLQVVAVLVATMVAKPALALTFAGMCDDDATSTVAPIPILRAQGGEILPVDDCEGASLGADVPDPGSPEASPLPSSPAERSTLAGVAWPPAPVGAVRSVTAGPLDPHRSGFTDGVFRPPRS